MGYYNIYQLTIHSGFADAEDHKKEIAENAKWKCHEMFGFKIKGYGNIFHDEFVKHSIKYPEVIFCLNIMGDDYGPALSDKWKIYYGKGKFQMCKEQRYFPEFDRKELSDNGHEDIKTILE